MGLICWEPTIHQKQPTKILVGFTYPMPLLCFAKFLNLAFCCRLSRWEYYGVSGYLVGRTPFRTRAFYRKISTIQRAEYVSCKAINNHELNFYLAVLCYRVIVDDMRRNFLMNPRCGLRVGLFHSKFPNFRAFYTYQGIRSLWVTRLLYFLRRTRRD